MATSIGRYELQKELGRGGMAAVYLAADTVMERQVALKLMLPQLTSDPQFIARFRREARAVAQLEHRGITPVYDYGVHQGRPYLVMRYMGGGSLRDLLNGAPLEPQKILKLIDELAPPLDYAHQKGIVHRDLKPDNILFDEYGSPYLSDFGIVKMIEGSVPTLTVTGGILGTPAYMSPEQARGNIELDGRSDVYALGVILFEMLSGDKPYKADTPMGLAMMHVLDPIPHLEKYTGVVSPQYQALINKAMAKDREERFQSAGALATALQATLATGPVTGSPPRGKPLAAAAVAGGTMVQPGRTGQTPATPVNKPTTQVAVGQATTAPAETAKRKLSLWMVVAAVVALLACFGVAAAAGALLLGSDETATPTATVSRTATPTETPALTRSGAAGSGLPSHTPTQVTSRTPTQTRPATRTPVNTPTLRPLDATPTTTPLSAVATATPLPPAAAPTSQPPTATSAAPRPATNTPRPATSTPPPVLPTSTPTSPPPPTSTTMPPTATHTPAPPPPTLAPTATNTPVPPPSPTSTSTF